MEKIAPVQPTQDRAPATVNNGGQETSFKKTPAVTVETIEPVTSNGDLAELGSAQEKYYIIEHPLYTAEISTLNGGSFASFKLNKYNMYDSTRVELIGNENSENLAISFTSVIDGQSITFSNHWYCNSEIKAVSIGESAYSLEFYTFYNAQKITKTFTFYPNTYKIDINTNLTSISEIVSQGTYSMAWPNGLPGTEKNSKDDYTYFKGYIYQAGELTTPRARETLKLDRLIGQTNWVAIRTKYFIMAMIPAPAASFAEIGGVTENGSKAKRQVFSVALALDSNSPASTALYLGPLEYKRIKGLGVELEKTMNFGWSFIRPIAKGILYLLTWMHTKIPNYGVVLIIFAIAVKIIVYPLTKKSHQSTKEMQAVQPLVNELREKYKNNPQKLNEETMKLYKEHGVNPLGGCLPLLLQMPLLFALFQVFRSTIELRGASFIWWIKDLSSPDTIFYLPFSIPIYGDQVSVLPIVMGISMFIQQRMMPAQASGQQKYMSYFMTGFFMLLFNNFPSGLNLYYTLFNVLTILQQQYLTPQHTTIPQPAGKKPAVKTSSKQRK